MCIRFTVPRRSREIGVDPDEIDDKLFRLGFNPKASLVRPKPPAFSSEAEKVMGCVNIGLGRAGLKGKQHTDVVAVGTTVEVDGKVLIKKGKYTNF